MPPLEFELWGEAHSLPIRRCNCSAFMAEYEKREKVRRHEKAVRLLVEAGLQMPALEKFTFQAWDSKRSSVAAVTVCAVRQYMAQVETGTDRNWLVLHGPYGTGKTHLSVAGLRKIAYDHLWRPMFAVWPQHCSMVQQSWGSTDGPSEAALWGQMRGADILVIDDIDKRDPTPWAMGKLYEVIDHRQARRKPTIITANHSLQALEAYWSGKTGKGQEHISDAGGAIVSRIMGQLWKAVEFSGEDQRWASK